MKSKGQASGSVKNSATHFKKQKHMIAFRGGPAPERPECALSHKVMATAEPKVMFDDLGCKAYASEDAFFQKFVFRVCDKKNARQNRKRFAAREIPGLSEYKGSRGVRWRLSYRQLCRDMPTSKLNVLLELIDQDSPFYRRIMGADERNRFFSASMH